MMKNDRLQHVDLELRPYLTPVLTFLPKFGVNRWSLPIMRSIISKIGVNPALPNHPVRQILVPLVNGKMVMAYLVGNEPAKSAPKPAVMLVHGGGFICGTAKASVRRAQEIALEHDCLVVIPEYSLAPETPFPGALEELYAILTWMNDYAGIDPQRIVALGESAGGGHVAALTHAVRDRGKFRLAAQILIYPMLDDRTGSTRIVEGNIGEFAWTPILNRFGWSSLLNVPAGSASVPKGAVPARETNLLSLPPAFIGVGDIDLFFQEDVDYARQLQAAKVEVDLLVVPGAYHAFDVIAPKASCSTAFAARWHAFLAKAFQVERAERGCYRPDCA